MFLHNISKGKAVLYNHLSFIIQILVQLGIMIFYKFICYIAEMVQKRTTHIVLGGVFAITLLGLHQTYADISPLYRDCIYAEQMSGDLPTFITIRPLGVQCFNRCQSACKTAFEALYYGEGQSASTSTNTTDPATVNQQMLLNYSINMDIYDQCIKSCQQSVTFSAIGYQYTYSAHNDQGNSPRLYDPTTDGVQLTNTTICPTGNSIYSADYAFINTGTKFESNTKVGQSNLSNPHYTNLYLIPYIANTVTNPDSLELEEPNTIYTCGFQTVYNYAGDTGSLSPNIFIADGDSLSLSYADINRGLAEYYRITLGTAYEGSALSVSTTTLQGDLLQTPPIADLTREQIQHLSTSAKASLQQETTQIIENNTKLSPVLGLSSRLTIGTSPKIFLEQSVLGALKYVDKNLYTGYRIQHFTGQLSGFSNIPVPLVIGGLSDKNLTLSWKGCKHTNGENLQYVVVPTVVTTNSAVLYTVLTGYYARSKGIKDTLWTDVEWPTNSKERVAKLKKENLAASLANAANLFADFVPQKDSANIAKDGILFLRIKAEDEETTYSGRSSDRYNTTGRYDIVVQPEPIKCGSGNIFTAAIVNYRDILFGTSGTSAPTGGVLKAVFQNTVGNPTFQNIVRMLLVIYIAYMGICFMAGISSITQREAVTRTFKIGVVVTLLSPTSWNFFNTYLFNIFVNGMDDLITRIVFSAADLNTLVDNWVCTQAGEERTAIQPVFALFSDVLTKMFSHIVWTRILALLANGLVGFMLGIALLIGVVLYAICLIKVFITYVLCLFAITILLMLAPLFLCFILFNYTKQLFDMWIKQLISFALQPVVLFASLSFFLKMLLAMSKLALHFSICKICWLQLNVFFFKICLIHAYAPVYFMHSGSSFSASITYLAGVFAFLLIAQSMYFFCSFVVSMTNTLVSFGTQAATNIGSPLTITKQGIGAISRAYNVFTIPADLLGVDTQSRKIKRDKEMQQKKLKESTQTSGTSQNQKEKDNTVRRGDSHLNQ